MSDLIVVVTVLGGGYFLCIGLYCWDHWRRKGSGFRSPKNKYRLAPR